MLYLIFFISLIIIFINLKKIKNALDLIDKENFN